MKGPGSFGGTVSKKLGYKYHYGKYYFPTQRARDNWREYNLAMRAARNAGFPETTRGVAQYREFRADQNDIERTNRDRVELSRLIRKKYGLPAKGRLPTRLIQEREAALVKRRKIRMNNEKQSLLRARARLEEANRRLGKSESWRG